MIATEKNKLILAPLDLVNKNYKDLPLEKEIKVGSFLASENSQEKKKKKKKLISGATSIINLRV